MRCLLFFILLLLSANISMAQFWPRYELYQFNLQTINPAFTGIKDDHSFNTQFFKEYSNKEYPSNNVLISYGGHFSGINSGIGLIFESSGALAEKITTAKLRYSYDIEINNHQILALGIGLTHLIRTIDYSFYQTLNPNDPLILSGSESDTSNDLDLGASYSGNNLLCSIGINNLLRSKGASDFGTDTLRSFRNIRTLTVYAQYEVTPTDYLAATPSLFLESFEGSNYYLDLNLNLKWIDLIITGFNYKITQNENFYSVFGGIEWNEKFQFIFSKNHYPENNWKNVELALNVYIP